MHYYLICLKVSIIFAQNQHTKFRLIFNRFLSSADSCNCDIMFHFSVHFKVYIIKLVTKYMYKISLSLSKTIQTAIYAKAYIYLGADIHVVQTKAD